MLVTVTSFREPFEAHLFRGRLRAEGLFAVVSHDQHVSAMWSYSVLLGGAKVQVSSDEIELARAVERACCEGSYKKLLQSQLGDLEVEPSIANAALYRAQHWRRRSRF